jgi:hypothetical protein
MMIRFEKDMEGLLDAKPDGYVVIPVNCQGIVEHTKVGRRFKSVFPESYETYMRMVYQGKLKPGSCVILEETGQPLALLVYADSEFGMFADREDDKATAFSNAVDMMFTRTKDLPKYYSGIIRINNIAKTLAAKANSTAITWIIQKD